MATPLPNTSRPEKTPRRISLPDEVTTVQVIRRNGEPVALRATTGAGRSPGQWPLDEVDELELLAGVNAARASAAKAAAEMSRRLLEAGGEAAATTQQRIGKTFMGYVWMLLTMFAVGIVAFGCAVIRGFTADTSSDVATTAIFGGLSAASFVTAFLSRPITAMGTAGPNNAWLLAIINTYWSKLAYFNDVTTVVQDLDNAQRSLNNDFITYLAHTSQGASGEPVSSTATTPNEPQRATEGQ